MEYPFKDLMPLDEVLEREGYYKDWTHLDPEVFYSLTQISEYIKTKGYGVDVRLLIAQLAEHFGLKTTQIVDLGNLLQAEHASLKTQVQQAVAQVNADRNALETRFNQSVAQMEADKNAVIANVTVDSEVILARGGKPTLGARLDETTAQLAQTIQQNRTYIDDQLNKLNGLELKGAYNTLQDLISAYPSGAQGIFLVQENGHWYYWNGTWSDGGLYQATPWDEFMTEENESWVV